MKTLLLMRHAKSSWKHETLSDHDRPLNKRGQKDAPRMGQLLAERNLVPDRILSSTALRARTTALVAAEQAAFSKTIELRPELYHADPETCIERLQELEDAAQRVLVVGHNPGLEELLEVLTGEEEHLPTAAIAQIELSIAHWRDLNKTTPGRLIELWRPKEL